MAITTTVTNAGRAKIINNGLLANARKIAFGTGYDSTPADATGLATPYSPEKKLDIVAGHQNGAQIQVVFQEGETPAGQDYSPTELVILDADDAVIAYAGVSTGALFTKGAAPHMWTYIGELVNLPANATINFTVSVGYFVATTEVRGVVELATDAEVATPPADYPRVLTTDNVDALQIKIVAAQITSGTAPNGSYVDSGLSVTITPSTTSKRILLELQGGECEQTFDSYMNITKSDNTILARTFHDGNTPSDSVSLAVIDSPASISAQTYKCRWRSRDNSNQAKATTEYPLVLKATEID